jgi:hypothetical protein
MPDHCSEPGKMDAKNEAAAGHMLKHRLRLALIEQAQTGRPITYRELADRLRLAPPQTIHRVTEALEMLMAEDRAAGRPLLAALCVGRLGRDLPARGFFMTAEALGNFAGDPEGPEARDFHRRELGRVLDWYREA